MDDLEAIRLTLAQYSRLNDYKDMPAWVDLYTEDARIISGNHDAHVGRPRIRQFIEAINEAQPDRDTCHFCGNSIISIGQDEAEVHTDVLVYHRPKDGSWVLGPVNHYTDVMVRRGADWLFAERRIQPRVSVVSRVLEATERQTQTDSEEIRRLLARYCFLLDNRNAPALSELFSADARLVLDGEEVRGRAAIREAFTQRLADAPPGHHTAHLATNIVETLEGATATVVSSLLVLDRLGEQPWQTCGGGLVRDRLVREADGWRIAERILP